MRLLIQRVISSSVSVGGKTVGSIGKGLLVLFGAGNGDAEELCPRLADKLCRLRIFEDENGRTNLSVNDVGGDILVVSQFTLYADCRRGNRPGFTPAAPPELADRLYRRFCECVSERISGRTETGVFGADMKVELINDGPFTVWLDSDEILK